jgi:hypothetical protein
MANNERSFMRDAVTTVVITSGAVLGANVIADVADTRLQRGAIAVGGLAVTTELFRRVRKERKAKELAKAGNIYP